MAAISKMQSRAWCISGNLYTNPKHNRFYSSPQTKNPNNCEESKQAKDQNVKPNPRSTSTKTKRSRAMARLINSKPWSDELQSSLSSLFVSPSKTSVLNTLRLIRTPTKALHFFNWTQGMGFAHNVQTYFLMLEILGSSRNLNAAKNFLFSIEKKSKGAVKLEDRFFNSLIRNYGEAGLFQESIKLFGRMKMVGISPSVVSFNSMFLVLLRRGRTNMAKSLYDEMLSTYGVIPDIHTFNILIRGFCMNSMIDVGFRFFKEMSRLRCDPDVITYNTLVDGLCRAGKVKIAHNLVKGMHKKSPDLNPNVVTYTTLIRGYCMNREIDEALAILKEMVNGGLNPNAITYNTLIKGLCEARKLDKIKGILEGTIVGGGFSPDTCTFNTLISGHCSSGNLDEAMKVFEKLSEFRVSPDSATYSVLIRNLFQRGDFKKAEELFDNLAEKGVVLSNVGCTPIVAAYNLMFEYLCGNGKTKKADKVFRQLMKRGTQDPSSYKTLIMGHCKEGTVKEGHEILVLMLRRDYVPDSETYESLINGLLQKGQAVLAHKTLESMTKSSHLPKTPTFHSILAALLDKDCADESASIIVLMLEGRIRQNISLSTRTLKLLFNSGLHDKALQIVGLVYDSGYVVEMEELIGFLCQSKKFVEACKMLLFCFNKNQKVNTDTCSTVVEGLCNIKRLSEAFDLYYKLVDKGMHQTLSCHESFKIALEAGGRSSEANFVSKRMLPMPGVPPSNTRNPWVTTCIA